MRRISRRIPGIWAWQQSRMERYYALHSRIYDGTRWAFLFGRSRLIALLPSGFAPARILEVGCGTGVNLVRMLGRYPESEITGIDMSEDMLDVAARRLMSRGGEIRLVRDSYPGSESAPAGGYDLILFSYCLSMVDPGWESMLDRARLELSPGGLIAVADFHGSPIPAFRKWMSVNNVTMDGRMLPRLRGSFEAFHDETWNPYCGLWSYFIFIGGPGAAQRRTIGFEK